MRKVSRKGFTLIELITVMAISAILLSIIVIPMVQTFAATRTAQSYSDAQDAARILTERVAKDIGQAVAVRDVEGNGGRTSIVIPTPANGIDLNGVAVTITPPLPLVKAGLNYTKLDLVMPQKVGQRGPGGGFIDPNTGKEDPTLSSEKGQVQLPIAPGTVLKRYWIGLRDPFRNYSNPYDGLLMERAAGRDNLFVLYSAEVEPLRMVETPLGSGNFVSQVNTDFFDVDPADPSGRTPLYDDPDFFLATGAELGAPVNNNAKAVRIQNWLRRANLLTEVSRYDLIQPVYEKSTRRVRLVNVAGNWSPQLTPLVQFRPSHVEGSGTDAMMTAGIGDETDGGTNIGSEVFQSQFGMWSSVTVRFYDEQWQPGQDYLIGRKATNDPRLDSPTYTFDQPDDYAVYRVNPALTGNSDNSDLGSPIFNITLFEKLKKNKFQGVAQARYPFTSSIVGTPTGNDLLAFAPFYTNANTGKIIAGFAVGDVGNIAGDPNASVFNALDLNPVNLPQAPAQDTGSGWVVANAALTPTTDPAVAFGTFSDTPFWDTAFNRFSINRIFNKVWADAQANRNGIPAQFGELGGAHRFIDLRTIPQGDGTPSPLGSFGRARIVPGSEEVFGPDQNPGSNFQHEVRYRRVNREPGPNEYRINYVNLQEPTAAGWAQLGLPVPPASYDRTNFVSAVVQPRFRAGYIQLCSNPEVPIPASMLTRDLSTGAAPGTLVTVPGRIRVAYRFQFSGANDVMRVEYDTRQLMQVLVTIRNYPQSSTPNPQTVTMKATASVKNFIR